MITVMLLIHGIYPFFVHTRLVGNLGILEYIFVTPSHHRVHHAADEKYLDKNFKGKLLLSSKEIYENLDMLKNIDNNLIIYYS